MAVSGVVAVNLDENTVKTKKESERGRDDAPTCLLSFSAANLEP